MAKFQHRIGGQQIDQFSKSTINKTELQNEIADLDAVIALPDATLDGVLATLPGDFADAAAYRNFVQDRRDLKAQQVRLWELDTQQLIKDEIVATLVRFDPTLGGAVDSFCGEEVGNEAAKCLTVAGKWQHAVDEQHSIVLDLGNPETIDAVGVHIDAGVNPTHQLRNVRVSASKAKVNLDDNVVVASADFATLDSDNLTLLDGGAKKKARYVRFDNIDTDNANNNMRVAYFLVRVVPKFLNEE